VVLTSLLFCLLAQTSVVQQSFDAEAFEAHRLQDDSFAFVAPRGFRSVGFWLEGSLPGAEVALFGKNGELGPWWPLALAEDLNRNSSGAAGNSQVYSLVHGGLAPQAGLRIRLASPQQLAQLTLLWIPAAALGAPSAGLAATGRPPVFDRASWGANPAVCAPTYCTTTHVAMHHTASAAEYHSQSWAECASNVKATQIYHMVSRGWCDIGYNYLICPHGDIFEGRGGGDDVRGAHDGFNCGSMGVAMMGYFHPPYNQTLNLAMQDAFVNLAAWKCDQQNIDPLGISWYAGFGANQSNLFGHRDVSSTACPGDLAYAELPQLRLLVDQVIQGGRTEIIMDNALASFSGGWSVGTGSSDKYGPDYRWASTGVATARALWNPNITQAGRYEISLWWPAGSNRNPSTEIGLLLNGQLLTAHVNQQQSGGQWNLLGTVFLPLGANTTIGLTNQGSLGWVVVADALRLVRQ